MTIVPVTGKLGQTRTRTHHIVKNQAETGVMLPHGKVPTITKNHQLCYFVWKPQETNPGLCSTSRGLDGPHAWKSFASHFKLYPAAALLGLSLPSSTLLSGLTAVHKNLHSWVHICEACMCVLEFRVVTVTNAAHPHRDKGITRVPWKLQSQIKYESQACHTQHMGTRTDSPTSTNCHMEFNCVTYDVAVTWVPSPLEPGSASRLGASCLA